MNSNALRSKGPELLADLADHVTAVLVELAHLEQIEAKAIATEIANRMASHWGGQNVYFPMGLSYKLSQRDRQIYDEFDGHNQSALARKYKVSIQWVYKIIKTVRIEEIAKRQSDMFPAADE